MAARSIASLTLSFGLVNVPVKLYSATETSSAVRFNLLDPKGSRLKQQYISVKTGKVVERADMVKGYEFEDDRYVTFTPAELDALDEAASHVIEIVAFLPEKAVDPIYYDKAYFLGPDKRGAKPYSLLKQALLTSGTCALARWTSKGKQYVTQVRANEQGLVLQQLLYAEEVRSMDELNIEQVAVSQAELNLALQLIEQSTQESYDPTAYKDDERNRILEAIDRKIQGKQVVEVAPVESTGATGQVIDLVEALRMSLSKPSASAGGKTAKVEKLPVKKTADIIPVGTLKDRKPVKRAPKAAEIAPVAAAPARSRARK